MRLDTSVQSELQPEFKTVNGKSDIPSVDGDDDYDFQHKSVKFWNYTDVADWLSLNGFDDYANLIAFDHKIDGAMLLTLSERDLREKPLEISCLGDIKRLSSALSALHELNRLPNKIQCLPSTSLIHESTVSKPQCNHRTQESVSDGKSTKTDVRHDQDMLVCVEVDDGVVPIANADPKILADTSMNANRVLNEILSKDGEGEVRRLHLLSREEIIRQVESPDTKGKSLFKLVVAFLYCSISLLITAFTMVVVHDRVPDMKTYPPLPDIVLDNLPFIPWAFEACELIAVCLSTIWFTILFFHKHRVVIMRRMFSLTGTVFFLRCVTMIITSLSVPGAHLECRAKTYGSLSAKLWHAYNIWSKLGMSIRGVRTCGDYMFSGHTTAITLLNHLITEYTPDTWHLLHTTTWVLNLFGIFFILAGHEHYSIDVFIAFYISSRMFLYYHAYAYNHYNLTSYDERMRLWFPLGWFFEAGGHGRVPNEFEFPFSLPDFSSRSWCRGSRPKAAEEDLEKRHRLPSLSLDRKSGMAENNNSSSSISNNNNNNNNSSNKALKKRKKR